VHVLHVIGSVAPRYGGPSYAALDMCSALAERGHEVELFTTTIDGPGDLAVPVGLPQPRDGFAITYFPPARPRSYSTSPDLARALARRVAEFDLVEVHNLYLFHAAAAAFACRKSGVPYVVCPHGTLDPYQRAFDRRKKAIYDLLVERRNLRRAAGIHCTSRAERDAVVAAGVPAHPYVVPLAVRLGPFESPADPAQLLVDRPELDGRTLVTFLGRLARKKRLDVLVEAFADVAAIAPEAHLAIAGPDDEGVGARVRDLAARRRLDGRISLLGMVDGEAKVALLQRSALFVLPSEDENFAVSLLEAMAAGVPVVTTEGVAIHDEIRRAEAGLVVPLAVETIATALLDLLQNRDLARRIGDNGRRLARSAFAWEQLGSNLERMYTEILERAG
jgi:glycosyltransferase involved in cell wall biosynthesis